MPALLHREFDRCVPLFRRRTPPVWRQGLGIAVLAGLVMAWATYGHLTGAARVREKAREILEDLTDGDVRIAAAEFDIFDGIHLSQVSVAIPEASGFIAGAAPREMREVFSCGDLYLKLDPYRLLLGHFSVNEIVAVNPSLVSVRRSSDGRFNWQELFSGERRRPSREPMRPRVRLRNATVRLYRMENGERIGTDTYTVHALARQVPGENEQYLIDLWELGGQSASGQLAVNTNTLGFQIVGGRLPEVTIESARAALPPGASTLDRWLTLLDLRGRLSSEDLMVTDRGPSRARVELSDVTLSLPLTAAEVDLPAERRFVQLTAANGFILFERNRATLEASALLRGSPCTVTIEATGLDRATQDLADLGIRAEVRVERFHVPADYEDPTTTLGQLAAQSPTVRNAFQRFKPRGLMDVSFAIEKATGRDAPTRIDSARVLAHDVEVAYHKFPYAITNLRGEITLDEAGVHLRDLHARHGPATMVINGDIGDFSGDTPFNVTIVGVNVPLDADFEAAMKPDHRSIYQRFSPSGTADITVRLQRERAARTNVDITAELRSVRGSFEGFPYALDDVRGQVRLTNDEFKFAGLTGRHGPAIISLDGSVTERGKNYVIDVAATGVPIDADLMTPLPDSAVELIRQGGIGGTVAVAGRVTRTAEEEAAVYDLAVSLESGTLRHQALPYALERVIGTIRLLPGRVQIASVAGANGDSLISLSGELENDGDTWAGQLLLLSPNLAIDQALRDALPEALADVWSAVHIDGRVRLASELSVTATPDQTDCRHRTTLETQDNSVTLAMFPMEFSQVSGTVVIDEEAALFDNIRGARGDATVSFDGRLDLTGEQRGGVLRVNVENLPMDDALRQAVPWRMRRLWNDIDLSGQMSLTLRDVAVQIHRDGSTEWTFGGRIDLQSANLNIGLEARELVGSLSGTGRIVSGGDTLSLTSELDVSSVLLNGRRYEDVTGHLAYDDSDGVLRLTGLSGRIHFGQVTGDCDVVLGEADTEYAASFVVRDVSLADLLNATRDPDEEPLDATGVVSGNLFLSGVSGDSSRRRGGGDVLITSADLFRLPVLFDVVSAADVDEDGPAPAQRGRAKFFLRGETIDFERFEVRSGSISMLGVGSLDLVTDRMDITVLATKAADLPDVPLLTELLEGATRELMEVRVQGTLASPSIQTTPLRSVDQALRTLFQSSRSSRGDELSDD